MKRYYLAFILSISASLVSHAKGPLDEVKRPGGGDLNPGVYYNQETMDAFQDMKIGLSVHWGPSSLGGREISWSRGEQIPKAEYDSYYKQFNPTKFDAQNWMDLMKEGGMKYIMLTSKHHDGFALWDSAYSEYDIANTPFKRNIVQEIVDAAKANDIVFGTYFSIIDWYHPDYQPYDHGGPGELYETDERTPDFERYRMFMKKQLHELIVDYGAKIIQLDGEWDPTFNHDIGSHLYMYLRFLDPSIIINNRVDVGREHLPESGMWDWTRYAGDFDERERMVDWVQKESKVFGRSVNPWQAWVTIDQAQWSYNETPRLLSSDEVIVDLVKTIGDGGNYLINLGPKPDGTFDKTQADIIRKMGDWVEIHAEGVYGTRAGPFVEEGVYTSTQKGDAIYLYVFKDGPNTIKLKLNDKQIERLTLVNGDELEFDIQNDVMTLSLDDTDSLVTMVKIKLD
uniref:alpha-L-fucosidase n=1 Tax=Ningiella ruwaisensis TaxID=2364274 RepID=UPI00109FCFA0|nr:alpha-L-fucosidase [Ningiella ruwaisensis]